MANLDINPSYQCMFDGTNGNCCNSFSELFDIAAILDTDVIDFNNHHQTGYSLVDSLPMTCTNVTAVFNDVLLHQCNTIGHLEHQISCGDNNVLVSDNTQYFEQQEENLSFGHPQINMSLGIEGDMNNLLPNEHNNYNALSPYVCSLTSSPYSPSTSVSSFEYCNHGYLDQELCQHCIIYGNNVNNNADQYVSSYLHKKNDTHIMDNMPISFNFDYSYYPSPAVMDNMNPTFMPNVIRMPPSSELQLFDNRSSEASSYNMNNNRRKINKKKPVCHICKLELNRLQDLKRHLMIHNGSKPFECDRCHITFARKDALKRHKESITGCKKYMKTQQ